MSKTLNLDEAQSVESAHGGGYEVWINMDANPGEFAIIRTINLEIKKES